jgi:hypothetical protein
VNAPAALDDLSCFKAGVTVGDLLALLAEPVELRGRAEAPVAGVATFRSQTPRSLS